MPSGGCFLHLACQ